MLKWFKRKLFESRVKSAKEMYMNCHNHIEPVTMQMVIHYWGLEDDLYRYIKNGGSIERLNEL